MPNVESSDDYDRPFVRLIWRLVFFSCLIFFFSSRRRHTRSDRDWSSDVCSSDLVYVGPLEYRRLSQLGHDLDDANPYGGFLQPIIQPVSVLVVNILIWMHDRLTRSEERRVGKEGRSRWSPYH